MTSFKVVNIIYLVVA